MEDAGRLKELHVHPEKQKLAQREDHEALSLVL